jgi:arylformamidase
MWKTLTTKELNQAYNSQIAVKDSEEIASRWISESDALRRALKGDFNLPYGLLDRQKYDFFSAGVNSPVVVYVHGGYWQMRSKDEFLFIVPKLLEAGISVAMLGYTLAPEASINQIVSDIKIGIRAIDAKIRSSSTTFKGLWLLGWSAGAHLITMTLDEPSVLGGTAVSGIYDLEPIMHTYVNEKLQLNPQSSLQNSPIKNQNHFLKPLDLFAGGDELPEMQRQTSDFFEYRQIHQQIGDFKILADLNHNTILDSFTAKNGEVLEAVRRRVLDICNSTV